MEWDLKAPARRVVTNLADVKAALDQLRDRIGAVDRARFRSAAAYVNPGEHLRVPRHLRLHSRAYHKLWEILQRHPLPPSDYYHAVFFCEAPGSFQQATEEWMRRYRPGSGFNWHGITLPGALAWKGDPARVVYADLTKDPLPPTCFNAHIVTGDGGFEVANERLNDQESANHALFAAQMYRGLECLLTGGTLVVKFFDMFNTETLEVLAQTAAWFQHASICKPWGSRICNSERYFVGLAKMPAPGPPAAFRRMYEIASEFADTQRNALRMALEMAAGDRPIGETNATHTQVAEQFDLVY